MPAATFESIISDLKSKKYAPIYFLQGDEPYYIDKIADYIEHQILSEAEKGFNLTVLYGKDTDMPTVLSAAKRFPMMAERQIVMVKEAQELKDIEKNVKVKTSAKETEVNLLNEYAQKPVSTTILVFLYKYKTLDGRKSQAKAIENSGVLFTSKGIYDNQVPDWVIKNIAEKGHTISHTAAQLLAELVGNNLTRLNNEIEKILSNFTQKTAITDAHVSQFIGVSKEYNVFELQKAMGEKNVLKCQKIIQYFAANTKDNPIQPILASLYNYFTKILLIKSAGAADENSIAKVLGIHPFVAKEYVVAQRNYSNQKTLEIFGYLRVADMKSKGYETTQIADGEILKELVFKILH